MFTISVKVGGDESQPLQCVKPMTRVVSDYSEPEMSYSHVSDFSLNPAESNFSDYHNICCSSQTTTGTSREIIPDTDSQIIQEISPELPVERVIERISENNQESSYSGVQMRITRMLLTVVGCYLISYFPWTLYTVAFALIPSLYDDNTNFWLISFLYINCILNPFVYILMYPAFRGKLRRVIGVMSVRESP